MTGGWWSILPAVILLGQAENMGVNNNNVPEWPMSGRLCSQG